MPPPLPPPLADDDPILAPIAGIDLGRYAELTRAIGHYGLRTQAEVDDFVTRAGHPPAAWHEAHAGWNARFKSSTSLAVLYAERFRAVHL